MKVTLRHRCCREVPCLLYRGAKEWGRQHQAPSHGGGSCLGTTAHSSPNVPLPVTRRGRGRESEQEGHGRRPVPGEPGTRARPCRALCVCGAWGDQRWGFQSPVRPWGQGQLGAPGLRWLAKRAAHPPRPPGPASCLRVAMKGGQGPGHWPGFQSLEVTQGCHERSPSWSGGRGLGVPSLLGISG